MTQVFTIDGELMDLNRYTNACRSHWSNGSRAKREEMNKVIVYIKKARLKPVKGPVEIGISWIEGRRRGGKVRDVDNIAFSAKFILDALVETRIIPDDNPRIVRNVYHYYRFNSENPHIEVSIMEYDPSGRTVHYMPISGLD